MFNYDINLKFVLDQLWWPNNEYLLQTNSNEYSLITAAMGCGNLYDSRLCEIPPEEDNYAIYAQLDTTRKAIHVGDLCFGCQSGDVYNSMINDLMQSQRDDVEYLMDRYSTLIYNGNFDM